MRPFSLARRATSGLVPLSLVAFAVLLAVTVITGGCAGQRVSLPPGAQAQAPAQTQTETADIAFLGEAVIDPVLPAGVRPLDAAEPAPIGGLSGLVFDPATGDYLAISDSRGEHGPVRIYTLAISLRKGTAGQPPTLAPDGARVLSVTGLLDHDGRPFQKGSVDPEGIALAPGGGFYFSSEGVAKRHIDPFVRRYATDGRMLATLPLPDTYRPRRPRRPGDGESPRGVRNNLGFEPLTVTPPAAGGPRYLFTGTENALVQDGPEATVDHGSRSRLLRWPLTADGAAAGPPTEWVYPVSPVVQAPPPGHPQPEGLPVCGLVEAIALGPHRLLTLERSYTDGAGTTVRLYRVRLDGATPVTGRASLADAPGPDLGPDLGPDPTPAEKTLLLDVSRELAAHGVPTDNLEGMTFGPDLPDGRRLLLMVSDDNFSHSQRTQVVAFAVRSDAL